VVPRNSPWMEAVLILIDVCSDLHVDHHRHTTKLWNAPGEGPQIHNDQGLYIDFDFAWTRNPGAGVIVIAGDISDSISETQGVLTEAARHYEHVVYVDGNHEFQGLRATPIQEQMDLLADMQVAIPNLIYLDGGSMVRRDIQGVAFIGGNGWYDWRAYEELGYTYPMCFASWDERSMDRHLNFGDDLFPNVTGYDQATRINREITTAQNDPNVRAIVVVTHTAPLRECLEFSTNPKYNVASPSYSNTLFREHLDNPDPGKLALWIYGHTHKRKMFTHNGVTLVNNCYGYPREVHGSVWAMANFEV